MAQNEMGTVWNWKRTSSSSSSSSWGFLLLLRVYIVVWFCVSSSTVLCQRSDHELEANQTTTARRRSSRQRYVSSFRLARIHNHLNTINKSPLLTIQSPDGDIIDCVHKRKQPALDHPLLKNHKIQRVAPEMPKMMEQQHLEEAAGGGDRVRVTSAATGNHSSMGAVQQLWHQRGLRCPKGTVPIRRSTVDDVLRAKSLYDYGKKQQRRYAPLARRADAPDVVSGNGHEHAIAYTGASEDIYGAKATINVWDPSIETVNEFSLSQIWVLSGSFDGSDLNSIEAGWQSGQSGAVW